MLHRLFFIFFSPFSFVGCLGFANQFEGSRAGNSYSRAMFELTRLPHEDEHDTINKRVENSDMNTRRLKHD